MKAAGVTSFDGHGPGWAAAVAALAQRSAAAFARSGVPGCFTVVDMQPWRQLDAWWLRCQLEPLARLTGLPGLAMRYVPCTGPARPAQGERHARRASAWSVGLAADAPVQLSWQSPGGRPVCAATGQPWVPDGPVLVLAGDLAQRLPQDLLLSHHGVIQEWRGVPGEPRKWHPLSPGRYPDWVADSAQAYAKGLPSAMFSLPVGYWQFLEQALAWASHGALVLARAEGWSSLSQFREDAALAAQIREDDPPVNFHWLSRQAHRLGASAHMVSNNRADALQLLTAGLPEDAATLALLGTPLQAATRAPRTECTRVVHLLAEGGDLQGALAVLQAQADDPLVLRMAWDSLAKAAAGATPALRAQLGAWLDRLMADNPWIGEDGALLRAAGHLALACSLPDLAQIALRALHESGWSLAADDVALAQCLEQLGQLDASLGVCDRATLRQPGHAEALAIRDRVMARKSVMSGPWRVQHGHAESPLMLDPLHEDHAPMLARQMRDPSIAFMTVLPQIAEDDDGRGWIKARLADGPAIYAVMHRQLGLVGYTGLHLSKTTAFISYWIGADYQGLGFCAPMISLAVELAKRNGIELMVSSVYDDNERSSRALRRSGFVPMQVRALPPDGDRTFVMLPAVFMEAEEARLRLLEFCSSTGSGLRFEGQEIPAAQACGLPADTETSRSAS